MIQFILNNQIIKTSVKSGVTLLDFIRDRQQLKGTKIGCREGDCGACTVLVGTNNEARVNYQSITSCISPLGNANGKHIVTIEGINLPSTLNTVQKAMTNNYATQCGFCTPGFVVSMTGFALRSLDATQSNKQTCKDAISGNICRCTGYKSIEKAGLEIERRLQETNGNNKINWLIKEGFIPNYFESIPLRLKELQNDNSSALAYHTPSEVEEISKRIKVANGTDLYVHHADKLAEENVHLLADGTALKGISFSEGICTLGANTTVTEIAENMQLQMLFPRLQQFLKLVSSEQIRNMGTLGGNFVNASPIGDMTIFFLALDSTLTIQKEDGSERLIPFHSFHQNYKVYDLQKNEIIKSISFEVPKTSDAFNFEKVSKRTHLDIASVNSAGKVSVLNNVITQAHFSVGGVAAIPKYLYETNEYLIGKTLDSKTVIEAAKVLQSEISPISDVRGSSTYKRLLATKLFFAHFIEFFPNHVEFDKLMTG